MNQNPVTWFEIYVDDIDRAKAFYEGTFQCTLRRLQNAELEMWAFSFETQDSGASGALIHMPGMSAGGNSTIVYFQCEDCSVEATRAVEQGGRIFKSKFSIGEYGFISLLYDTEGNMIGLVSRK